MSLLPVAVFGLRVPAGEIAVPAASDFPATIRITMAAIDPTEEPETDEDGKVPRVPRSTLKIIKQRMSGDMDSDDEDDDSYLQELLADDDESDESDEEANGGPSDPSKSKKARQEAAIKKLLASASEEDSDEDMADAPNGKSKKGKAPATEDDDEDDEEDSDDDSELDADMEDHVICTLDLEKNFQQPLDIVIGEDEQVFFMVSGTHSIHLTGNYVTTEDDEEGSDYEDDDDYDLPPGMEDLLGDDESVSDDDLDGLDGAERIEEIDTDDEEAPKLVKAKDSKKGKKRPAEDEAEGLDELIAKEAEAKLSKKQLKKLKNNKGEAVETEVTKQTKEKATPAKGDKKVQFAKNLEQGPTGSAEKPKADGKATVGVKVVQGVTIDDRKIGQGRVAKSGDKVSMRYIGKLKNGKVFDANKKGAPFTFKLGKGEVIKGWDIGVAGMAVGGERRLTIPAPLAYGSSGVPGIPGNSTLTFDVKLLEIK